ncbi:MAG: hypothetical protein K0R38_242, partial [Polyangiaceae bacterium]|nr:hypothetical protein [Polyangiaceae bacterium]
MLGGSPSGTGARIPPLAVDAGATTGAGTGAGAAFGLGFGLTRALGADDGGGSGALATALWEGTAFETGGVAR